MCYVTVEVENPSDGIWLECDSCAWRSNAGVHPSPYQILALSQEHMNARAIQKIFSTVRHVQDQSA